MGIEPPTSCVESREGSHYTTRPLNTQDISLCFKTNLYTEKNEGVVDTDEPRVTVTHSVSEDNDQHGAACSG